MTIKFLQDFQLTIVRTVVFFSVLYCCQSGYFTFSILTFHPYSSFKLFFDSGLFQDSNEGFNLIVWRWGRSSVRSLQLQYSSCGRCFLFTQVSCLHAHNLHLVRIQSGLNPDPRVGYVIWFWDWVSAFIWWPRGIFRLHMQIPRSRTLQSWTPKWGKLRLRMYIPRHHIL